MKRHELIVIGAGPAGLSAAIEAKKNGMDVIVFDENQRPGGQLFKQIHKFFGSKEHHAKVRGFRICHRSRCSPDHDEHSGRTAGAKNFDGWFW